MLFGHHRRGKAKEIYPFIDMHCHVLPGLDDGSRDMEESLRMLRIARDEGITDMIVTPHYKSGHHNASPERILKSIDEVTEAAQAEGIDIALYPGNEVYYFQELEEKLDDQKLWTMNGTDRVLVEFSPIEPFSTIRNAMDDVLGMGLQPILAHIERYECMVSQPENAALLKDMGVEIQVNAGDVTGDLGGKIKKYLRGLLEQQLVDYVGTDAHRGEGMRSPRVQECCHYLYKNFGAEYAERITCSNALAMLEELSEE